jgi:cold shock protein
MGEALPSSRAEHQVSVEYVAIGSLAGMRWSNRDVCFIPPPAMTLGRLTAILVSLGRRLYRARATLEAEVATGTVKWFNPTKGYGFIQPSGGGGGRDVFVHISAVEQAGLRSLNEGQTVEYEIESNRGKESAVRLKVR